MLSVAKYLPAYIIIIMTKLAIQYIYISLQNNYLNQSPISINILYYDHYNDQTIIIITPT